MYIYELLQYYNENDLDMEAMKADIKKFADDTKLGKKIGEEKDREELQEALTRLEAWALRWGMQFNVAKCKGMHLGRNNPRYKYSMGGQ